MEPARTLARAVSERGEIALRERGEGAERVHELIVNGTFAVDSAEVASELALADAIAPATEITGTERVLIGGLGLGFTAERLLTAGVGELVIAEIEGALIRWARDGVTAQLQRVAADPRVTLLETDVADHLRASEQAYDAIALDVDNGPDFLIHAPNAALYGHDLLSAAVGALRPGGVLAIWCQGRSDLLAERLAVLGPTDLLQIPVERDGHHIDYAIHRVRRAGGHRAE